MAGGIFIGRPFNPNIKCVIFGFLLALMYIYLPRQAQGKGNPLIIALIFIISYIAMAWYDFAWDCNDKMFSGTGPSLHFGSIFKPQYRRPGPSSEDKVETDYGSSILVAGQEKIFKKNVYFFHAFIVAPLLMYVGYYGASSNSNVWGALGGMGAMAAIYHTFRLFYPREVWN